MRVYTHRAYDGGSDDYIGTAVRHYFGGAAGFKRINGAPHVMPTGAGYISVTHSGSYIAIALSDAPVGIDVEIINEGRNYRAIALKAGWDAPDAIDFYKRWTEYEARIKSEIAVRGVTRYYDVFSGAVTAVFTEKNCAAEFYPLEQLMIN